MQCQIIPEQLQVIQTIVQVFKAFLMHKLNEKLVQFQTSVAQNKQTPQSPPPAEGDSGVEEEIDESAYIRAHALYDYDPGSFF